MRIFDDENDKNLDLVTLFLEKEELHQLLGYIKQLLEEKPGEHVHFSSDDYQKEITICSYEESELDGLNERAKKLILHDE